MIEKELSTITYDEIVNELGSGTFNMPSDDSDALRTVASAGTFEQVKKGLIEEWGDMKVVVSNSQHWYDQVKLINKAFNDAQKSYIDKKAAWCAKYGCD